jgi:glycine cleavage system H protein
MSAQVRKNTMTEFLETTIDKFIFKVAKDRFYSREGIWVEPEFNRVRIGISDFLQQRSGDVAFAEVKPPETKVMTGEEVASIETIKVTISLTSPVSGRVLEVNPALSTAPEVINQDPYGEGWLAIVEAADWKADRAALMDPQAYFNLMKDQAEETKKS